MSLSPSQGREHRDLPQPGRQKKQSVLRVPGICFNRVLCDTEMTTVMKEVGPTHRSLKRGGTAQHGEAPVLVSRQREQGWRVDVGESVYRGFRRKEQMRQGKQAEMG